MKRIISLFAAAVLAAQFFVVPVMANNTNAETSGAEEAIARQEIAEASLAENNSESSLGSVLNGDGGRVKIEGFGKNGKLFNADGSEAQEVQLNTTTTFSVAENSKSNVKNANVTGSKQYPINPTSDGVFNASISVDTAGKWEAEIIQISDIPAEAAQGMGYYVAKAELAAGANVIQLAPTGVKANSSYFLSVKWTSMPDTAIYVYSSQFTAALNWEGEFNNTASHARELKPAETVNGAFGYYEYSFKRDVDFYKVSVPSKGVLRIKMTNPAHAGKYGYTLFTEHPDKKGVAVVGGKNKAYTRDEVIFSASKTAQTGTPIGVKKGVYYIAVSGEDKESAGLTYTLNADFEKNDNWETESNDTYNKAQAITIGRPINGSSYGGSVSYLTDNDWFKINIKKAGSYDFDFVNPNTSKGGNWYIHIYKGAANAKKEKRIKRNGIFSPLKKTSYSKRVTLEKGAYYVQITSFAKNLQNSKNWVLTVSEPTTKLKSFKLAEKGKVKSSTTVKRKKSIVLKTANFSPANTPWRKGTWASSNTNIATVTQSGKVVGVKKGKVKITCTIGSKKATMTVAVK